MSSRPRRIAGLSALALPAIAVAVALAAPSCGGDTERDDDAAADGTGGQGAAGPGSGASGGAAPASASSSSGAGGSCGGLGGASCPPDAFCDYPDDLCGATDGTGVCVPKPRGCNLLYSPTCACDGNVYGNSCEANVSGFDANSLDGCTPPEGMFSCGSTFCTPDTDYCQQIFDDTGGPTQYGCSPLPPGCSDPSADCSCLANEPCGFMCEQNADGGFTLTCPGG